MNIKRMTRNFFIFDLILLIVLALFFATPFLDFRDYNNLPVAEREWNDIRKKLDGEASVPFNTRISNPRAFRTKRSLPVKTVTGAIKEYSITGVSDDRVYFLNNKTNVLTRYFVGEVIEDHLIVGIGDGYVELEKDGESVQLAY